MALLLGCLFGVVWGPLMVLVWLIWRGEILRVRWPDMTYVVVTMLIGSVLWGMFVGFVLRPMLREAGLWF